MALVRLPTLYCGSLLVIFMKTATAGVDTWQQNFTSKDDVVEMIFQKAIPSGYDPDDRPPNASIGVVVEFLSVASVEFSRTEIEVEFTFIASWKDGRLIFDDDVMDLAEKYSSLRITDIVKKRLWVPWIYFPECKLCKDSFITGKEPRPMWFTPNNTGLWIAFKDIMSFSCQFDLTFYPFDVHTCSIALQLEADGWMELNDSSSTFLEYAPDRFIRDGMPAEFYFDNLFVEHTCSPRSFGPIDDDDHCLKYGIRFHRIAAYYLMLVYTPSFIIVVISWITFWLPTEASAPRVALGLTSLLTLTAQFASAQKDLPAVAYVKALDVWMLMCVVMVFGSLLEFALAHNSKFQHPDAKPVLKRKELQQSAPTYTAKKVKLRVVGRKAWTREATTKGKQVNWLDAKARVFFPFVFVLFNLIYWPYYGRGGTK